MAKQPRKEAGAGKGPSVRLDDAVHLRLKIYAAGQRSEMKDVATAAVDDYLKKRGF